jgi:hypothetical protein
MDGDMDAAPAPRNHHSPRRLSRRNSPDEAAATRPRLKSEINLTRELIDFDLIKGCESRLSSLAFRSLRLYG